MRSSRAPRNVQECLQVTWTRPKRKQKIPKHRKRKPSGPKASKCLQNSTNSHAFEPDHELSQSIIGATQGPQGGCKAPPGTTQAPGSTLPSVPGNVPGAPRKPRNSPRTLSRPPERPQAPRRVPKAHQRPARRSLEAQEDRQRHESGPPSLKGRSKPASHQPQVPSVVPSSLSSNWATKHRSLKASSGLGGMREAETII